MKLNTDKSIDRIYNPSYEDFNRNYLLKEKPVVICDVLDKWAASEKWTPSYFKDNFSDKTVSLSGKDMALGDFIDQASNADEHNKPEYLKSVFIRDSFQEIAADIEPDLIYTLPDRLRSYWMFNCPHKNRRGIPELLMTGKGGQFNMHFDVHYMLGFIAQFYGRKEFIMFSPDQSKYLYQSTGRRNHSEIPDVFNPDLSKYPLLEKASGIRFILNPGEVLFNPAGWWHTTRILDFSIAIVVSTVGPTNWKQFCNDFLFSGDNKQWKSPIKKFYIAAADLIMRAEEKYRVFRI